MRLTTRFDGLADRSDFVVVYPEGYQGSWNDGSGNTPAQRDGFDDIAFIRALIESLVASEAIDPDRVAVAGFFNASQEMWNFVTTNTHPAVARRRPAAES